MKISKYDPKIKWKKEKCSRCGKFRYLCQHHIEGRTNSDDCVWICSNGNPKGIVYPDACHQWIHDNPRLAKKEGYSVTFNSNYKKKKRKKTMKLDYIEGTYILKK